MHHGTGLARGMAQGRILRAGHVPGGSMTGQNGLPGLGHPDSPGSPVPCGLQGCGWAGLMRVCLRQARHGFTRQVQGPQGDCAMVRLAQLPIQRLQKQRIPGKKQLVLPAQAGLYLVQPVHAGYSTQLEVM